MEKANKIIAFLIILVSPLIIHALIKLQPTFDDWTYLTYPNDDPDFWKFILPWGNYWRPFDAAFGYLVSIDLRLFPALNHIVIYIGHLLGAIMVYAISKQLDFTPLSSTVSAVFYFISPAMLGAVLDIDSINQIYSALFGLAALWFYLSHTKHHTALWITFCTLATLSKENGMMWIIIAPLVGYAFRRINKPGIKHDLIIAIIFFTAYWAIRWLLPHVVVFDSNQYINFDIQVKIANLMKFMVLTLCSVDFISLFYEPARNVLLPVITAVLSMPLLYVLFVKNPKVWKRRESIFLILAALVASAPHVLTLFSTMHAYAALGIVALLIGYIISQSKHQQRLFTITFCLYVLSAVIVDARHYVQAYRSGMTGYNMAQEVISQTGKIPHKAYCICIDRGEPKYSMFCVIPYDAFGWGNAVYFHTHHQWPKVLHDEIMSAQDAEYRLNATIKEKFKAGYDHVWIVDGKHVRVVEP